MGKYKIQYGDPDDENIIYSIKSENGFSEYRMVYELPAWTKGESLEEDTKETVCKKNEMELNISNEEEKLLFILEQAKQGVHPKIIEYNMRVFGFSEQFIERIILEL